MQMRKSKKEIHDESVINDVLGRCLVGRLGTIGRDGWPMVKPLNFVHHDGKIFFHTAAEGEKIDDIRRDNRVCFEVDLPIAYVKGDENPCRAEFLYRSVIIKGRASLVESGEERIAALAALMKKYQPEGGYGDFRKEKLGITGVVRIDIEETAGKEDLGKGPMREKALRALTSGERLPVTFEAEGY